MSFSFSAQGPADEVRATIKNGPEIAVPTCLREFVLWAIHGEKCHNGPDCIVTVSVTGHLCADAEASVPSNASISVSSVAAPVVVVETAPVASGADAAAKTDDDATADTNKTKGKKG